MNWKLRFRKPTKSLMWQGMTTLLILISTGCMFGALKNEIQEGRISSGLVGRVVDISKYDGDVIVLLYAKEQDHLKLDRYTLPDDTGRFSFLVAPGNYFIAAFEDRNQNQRHDPGEPTGAWGLPDEIIVPDGLKNNETDKPLPEIILEMTAGAYPVKDAVALADSNANISSSLAKLGVLAKWDDPAFEESFGSTGYWKPISFLKEIGTGIYFMAPYDQKKIPVLFVHGASGTPKGWQTMADSLDSQRFQPWVFYYPR